MVYTDGTHLVADTLEELHEFAAKIGLRPEWFQDHPRHPHYDTISEGKRRKALKSGAYLLVQRILYYILRN